MSDDIDGLSGRTPAPAVSPEDQAKSEARKTRRYEYLARGRETAAANRAARRVAAAAAAAANPASLREAPPERDAPARDEPVRQVRHRVESESANVGMGFDPSPAGRAAPPRDEYAPEAVVTRVRREDRQVNALNLPEHRKKRGLDYEFKTIRVLNQPVDRSDFQDIRNAGWRPENACDWPELVEPGCPADAPVEMLGQRLYSRPKHLTMEARQEDLAFAMQQQRDRTKAAASGQSAIRGGEGGMSNDRGVRTVPVEITIQGLAGGGTGRGA